MDCRRHHKEIASGHGDGDSSVQNHLRVLKHPSMTRMGGTKDHEHRFSGLAVTQVLSPKVDITGKIILVALDG